MNQLSKSFTENHLRASTNSLREKLDTAESAIAKATSIDEVVMLRDYLEDLRGAIARRNVGLELQNQAAELKLVAERKAGSMLSSMPKAAGGRPSSKKNVEGKSGVSRRTLSELGISYKDSERWQLAASVAEEAFADYVAECTTARKEITSAGLRRRALRSVDAEIRPKPSDWWAWGEPAWSVPHNTVPGEIYANALYYWAPLSGIAVDPMAGSGTLRRVYEDRHRWQQQLRFTLEIHLFDLYPWSQYADQLGITKHDAREPLPFKADFIFLDPPYFLISQGKYSGVLANTDDYPTWLANMTDVIRAMAESLAKDGKLCILLPKTCTNTAGGRRWNCPADTYAAALDAGLEWFDVAYVCRGRQSGDDAMRVLNADAVRRRRLLNDTCVLNVFRSVSDS